MCATCVVAKISRWKYAKSRILWNIYYRHRYIYMYIHTSWNRGRTRVQNFGGISRLREKVNAFSGWARAGNGTCTILSSGMRNPAATDQTYAPPPSPPFCTVYVYTWELVHNTNTQQGYREWRLKRTLLGRQYKDNTSMNENSITIRPSNVRIANSASLVNLNKFRNISQKKNVYSSLPSSGITCRYVKSK